MGVGYSSPKRIDDLPNVLPRPPEEGEEEYEVREGAAAVHSVPPSVSVSVQTDSGSDGVTEEVEEALIDKVGAMVEARLATFWERVSQRLPIEPRRSTSADSSTLEGGIFPYPE